MLKLIPACVIVGLVMPSAAMAGPYEDGLAAFQRGDYPTALSLLRPLAAQGDAGAETQLGSMYANGQGVTTDYAAALKWEQLAAKQGLARAQENVGWVYFNGAGVHGTTPRQPSGTYSQPTRVSPAPKIASVICISRARASPRTMPRR